MNSNETETKEMLFIYAGIAGMVIGAAGFICNLGNYLNYNSERNKIASENSAIRKNVKEYNKNIEKMNNLANKANNHVYGGIACLILGGASGVALNYGKNERRNRLLREKRNSQSFNYFHRTRYNRL